MVNLITPQTARALASRYYLRLLAALLWALATAIAVALVLLLPSYFLIHAEADQASEYVQIVSAIADQRAKGEATDTLASFKEEIDLLLQFRRDPLLARTLSFITADVPKGISIDTIDVTVHDTGGADIRIAGSAATRAILIAYKEMLKKSGDFSAVTVPVSDLVADINSGFSMQLSYRAPPKP